MKEEAHNIRRERKREEEEGKGESYVFTLSITRDRCNLLLCGEKAMEREKER